MSKKSAIDLDLESVETDINDLDDLDGLVDSPELEPVEAPDELDVNDALELETVDEVETVGVREAELDPISLLIKDIDDEVQYPTILTYGKNGTGKTTMLSTFNGMLVIAAEDGTLSIRDKVTSKTAKKLVLDTWGKLEALYWLLEKSPRVDDGIEINIKGGTFLVKAVAFDTVTKLASVCMRNVILGDEDTDTPTDVLTKRLKDWGDMSNRMKFWLQKFSDLPILTVWNFQEDTNGDNLDEEEYTIYPAINRSLRIYAQSEADIIGRTRIMNTKDGVKFVYSTKPNGKYVTKDRTNKLTGHFVNPDLQKMYDKVFK